MADPLTPADATRMRPARSLFIGVDVGTGSARAGVFDAAGALLGVGREAIQIWRDPGDFVEQSSDDIWRACCVAVHGAMAEAGATATEIGGLAFDATCSIAVVAEGGAPLPVGRHGDPRRNVIVWMDHRAVAETAAINAGGHAVLDYVGGAISPEMQTPKLLWLKRHLPETFARAGHFFDLSDFLTWKATGDAARSSCTVTCKWTYLAHADRWDPAFFRAVGLEEIADEGFRRIGERIAPPGAPLGAGLTAEAAEMLGLLPGTAVAASLIDAHAGALGTVGSLDPDGNAPSAVRRLAYIIGTSACIMSSTVEAQFVPGIWGPYRSALLPEFWLNEGGQSAAGAAIDHLVRQHPAFPALAEAAKAAGADVLALLEAEILSRFASPAEACALARDVHVLPDFLGNRSPYADPDVRGAVLGLDLNADRDSLARLYLAALCGLGYAAAEVVEALSARGGQADTIVASGGGARSALVRQIIADATGLPVAVPTTAEPVLLGSAMLAAVAAGRYPSLASAMPAMSRIASTVSPSAGPIRELHAAKRRIFDRLRLLDRDARTAMAAV
ncbi:FGGY-family carbohydrate kinase [Alsobacter sp. KACC 23698]|uniref:FGGY-family carbohydrate kinase n=1 Tax=Alsobacter sp. KACC 23698 TaxID=3149229 RepID=A0AAU7JLP5_9HYPH